MSDKDKKVAFIPEEAIKTSELAKKKQDTKPQGKPDKYSEERVSADNPSNEEVKREIPDTNVKGG